MGAVLGLADDLEATARLHRGAHEEPQIRAVVDEEQPDGGHDERKI
jgi:hypothetical protein